MKILKSYKRCKKVSLPFLNKSEHILRNFFNVLRGKSLYTKESTLCHYQSMLDLSLSIK